MLIIGSHALLYHVPGLDRQPRDVDVICTYDEYDSWVKEQLASDQLIFSRPLNQKKIHARTKDGVHWEFEIAWPGSTAAEILEIQHEELAFQSHPYASKNMLLLLKESHKYLRNSPHFHKTREDIHLLRKHGAVIPREWRKLLARREAETYTYAHPKLNQSKKAFFTDSVPYKYEHDDIHIAVAQGDCPAYTLFAKDGEEVKSDRRKFFKLTHQQRLLAGVEEASVLAIERSLVPFGTLTPSEAFLVALEKVCTSITSGWFREYCWEHYDEIVDMYDPTYFDRFNVALAAGKIRPYSGRLYND